MALRVGVGAPVATKSLRHCVIYAFTRRQMALPVQCTGLHNLHYYVTRGVHVCRPVQVGLGLSLAAAATATGC